jgi:hypothetical protein
MKAMNIELTKWQTEILKPLFDRAKTVFDKDPCGIFAQIWENADMDKPGFMVIRVVNGDICRAIQAITGVENGKIGIDAVTVLQPEG